MLVIENLENEFDGYFCKYDKGYLKQYSELFMLMYVYLRRYGSIEGYVNLTIKDFLLYYNYSPNRSKGRINDKVYKILNIMIDDGFIEYVGCYSNGGLATLDEVDCNMMFTVRLINIDEKWDQSGNFVKLLYSEIDTLRSNGIKQMGKVLCVYVNIKKHISADVDSSTSRTVSFSSENTLSRECDCGVTSIKKYTNILCDIGMLYVKNFGSYLKRWKDKEMVVNSNNVYALEEKYLDDNAKRALQSNLELNYGFVDGFYPSCNNLPDTKNDIDDDIFGELSFI